MSKNTPCPRCGKTNPAEIHTCTPKHEVTLMNEAANDLCRAAGILTAIDHNLGDISSNHYQVILSCNEILQSVARDLLDQAEEGHD